MLLTETEVRAAARLRVEERQKSAGKILADDAGSELTHFDIFLSHTIKDAELVLGVAKILEGTGKSTYVDWLVDPHLDRTDITPETASSLRERMQQCDSLFYLYSYHSKTSRWMPWELGYFDGRNGNVAVLPIVAESGEDTFVGSEYLGLYPYVDIAGNTRTSRRDVFVNRNANEYALFSTWKQRADKLRPRVA
jgi:TIR domain-containing protein